MSADLLKRLIESGAPADIIADVAMLVGEVAALERRRESERQNSSRYRARGGGQIPGWMRHDVFERDGYQCVDCGSSERLECDHILPLMAGGETIIENLQTLCKPCNVRKRDRIRKADKRGQTRTKSDNVGDERNLSDRGGLTQTPSLEVSPENPLPKSNPSPPYSPPASPKRGTRLPDDFVPPEDWVAWAMKKRGWSRDEAIDEAECFARFWQAKPGREACKLDWPKTWQNWAVNSRRVPQRAESRVPL